MSATPTLPLNAYYEAPKRAYWVEDRASDWIIVDKETFKLRLNRIGYSSRRAEGQLISAADNIVLRTQDEQNVQYVGPLAGHQKGVHHICGNKVLVTCSPQLVVPVKGEWRLLAQVINQQLKTPTLDQTPYFHGWMQLSERGLRAGHISYAPALTLAGRKGCGKSLLQDIITEVLGGRSAKPYRYMAGKSEFNHDLFIAEHQIIADEQPFTDTRSRVQFGSQIKQITATVERSCHGKGRDAINLKTFMRLSISINDELHNLQMLPPLNDDSLQDKFILLHCHKHPMPMPAGTPEQKDAFWKALKAEIPAYVHWLQNEFVIPDYAVDHERHGVMPYLHPGLMARLDSIAPETKLLALTDQVIFADPALSSISEWCCTSEQLANRLYQSDYAYEAKQILKTDQGCGQLLGSLAFSKPHRVQEARSRDSRNWIILRAKPELATNIVALDDVTEFVPVEPCVTP